MATASLSSPRDYRIIPELDRYESEGLDLEDEDLSELSPGARAAAEEEMRRRDRDQGVSGWRRRNLHYGEDWSSCGTCPHTSLGACPAGGCRQDMVEG